MFGGGLRVWTVCWREAGDRLWDEKNMYERKKVQSHRGEDVGSEVGYRI